MAGRKGLGRDKEKGKKRGKKGGTGLEPGPQLGQVEAEGLEGFGSRIFNFGRSEIDKRAAAELAKKQRTAAWAVSLNHRIVFDDTWKAVDDLEILIKRLKAKKVKDGKMKGGDNSNNDVLFESWMV
ncbi:hypothetical protein RHMOL_Rhmol06G0023800 [Rhododendron molle]|uniref:Uncharacterized protein n=1 Tax=Rhododendron molle TaxID=49168 RepID=A0ACC0N870_RHOML|nr:hypothetical protein RHMOL_Rhmol06G0023800 [Rhododendron molle]